MIYFVILIILLHVLLLVAVLWQAPAEAPHEREIHTIDAQLINPDAAPQPAAPTTPHPPTLTAHPPPLKAAPPHPKSPQPPTPTLPLQAAPSSLAPSAAAPSVAAPAAVATPDTPPPAPQAATLAATAPKNVEHLDCAVERPEYPALSRRNGETGSVLVQLIVDTQGHIESASVRQSSGHPRLDDAALQAARDSRCRPYLENGQAIRTSAVVPFRFIQDD